MSFWQWFYEYFIKPIQANEGYNIVNTLTYAVILGIMALLLYRKLKKIGIKFDERFFKALIPYIILGPLTRAMTDALIYPRTYLTVTPGIYFVIATIALASLYIVWRNCGSGEKFYPLYRDIGWLLVGLDAFILLLNLGKVHFVWKTLYYFIPAVTIAESFIWILSKKITLIRENRLLFYAHFYDATSTFVGVDFMGYWEQHVLSRFLIKHTGTAASMYALKFIVIFLVVWLLDQVIESEEEKEMANFMKMVIFILGFAPGTRNLLRMLMGA